MLNLEALNEAASRLTTKAGFKLYIYLAKNQDNYTFALSRADFMKWSNTKDKAYISAFEELVEHHYLILEKGKNFYIFFDKPEPEEEHKQIYSVDYKF